MCRENLSTKEREVVGKNTRKEVGKRKGTS
jgi:hypothetical protein